MTKFTLTIRNEKRESQRVAVFQQPPQGQGEYLAQAWQVPSPPAQVDWSSAYETWTGVTVATPGAEPANPRGLDPAAFAPGTLGQFFAPADQAPAPQEPEALTAASPGLQHLDGGPLLAEGDGAPAQPVDLRQGSSGLPRSSSDTD
ncbi:hypothetical protein ACFPTX_09820 [Pseudomonas sp. GCM10022188]|uniref:hypothetical protein n=1 Tax=Pseudomonas TaxID=286 RepID=UPI001E5F214E|nr:hypothetical protein [Pseudomonas oryzagri]MCC6074964.1 hypothetical protein [Pseudomonas oryzagri]